MSTTESSIRIRKLDEEDIAAFLVQYPMQNTPQPCFVALDLEGGQLWADVDGEVGGAVPASVWHGRTIRWWIPPLTAQTVNALLGEIAPLAQRVFNDSEVEWNGNNNVGRLGADAILASAEIAALCEAQRAELSQTTAEEFFEYSSAGLCEELGITATTSDADLALIAEKRESQALQEDGLVVADLYDYLVDRRDEL